MFQSRGVVEASWWATSHAVQRVAIVGHEPFHQEVDLLRHANRVVHVGGDECESAMAVGVILVADDVGFPGRKVVDLAMILSMEHQQLHDAYTNGGC